MHSPLYSFTAYIEKACLVEATGISDGNISIENIVVGLQTLLNAESKILELADEANDEGSNAVMSDYIRQQ